MFFGAYVLAVMFVIVKTGGTIQIGVAENDERSVWESGNYQELANEMRALRDTVHSQGDKLVTMEKEIENLKGEVGEQKRKYNMMTTIVKRQHVSLNAQRKVIEKLKRQNIIFETFMSKIRDNGCKENENAKQHGDLEADFEAQSSPQNRAAASGHGQRASRNHSQTMLDSIMNLKPPLPVNSRTSSLKHSNKRVGKNERASNYFMKHMDKSNKRLVLGSGSGGIAFSAYLSHTITGMANGQTVKCDVTLLNDGGAYNVHTGVFTAPKSGVYFFFFAIHAWHKDTVLLVDLTVDSGVMVDASIDERNNQDNKEVAASNAAILHLWQGQSVWLTAYPVNQTASELDSGNTNRHVTFSGFLLYS